MKRVQIVLNIDIPDEMGIDAIGADEFNGETVVISFASEPALLPKNFVIGEVDLLSVSDANNPAFCRRF